MSRSARGTPPPLFEAPEPTAQTIIGIGVGEPTTAWPRWDHEEAAPTLVAIPAWQEPTVTRRVTSTRTYRARRAGLVPGPVPEPLPELARGSAPTLLRKMPVLERQVFQLARRIALQADLPAAMRVLHHGLSRLTDSPDVTCVFFDAALCSAWVVPDGRAGRGLDDQVQQLVARVAGSGQRAVLGHTLVEPVGPAPARAVFVVRRPPTGTLYGELEIATAAAIAAALVGLIGHFVAEHVAGCEQARRDARSPFGPEALAARRGATAVPGRPVPTARTWIRWAYPTLIGLVAAVIVAASIVQVPSYSTGASIVKISPGTDLSVVALLPGRDRPRLEVGMTLQIELSGYRKKREQALIDAIGAQVIGPEEARRTLGEPIGGALPVTGPVVIVHAHLTGRTFEADGRTYEFHDGMLGKAEVKLDHQSLLHALLSGKGK